MATVVERFADWAASFRAQKPAPDAVHHAKRAVIDWYAALLPGAVVAPAANIQYR